MRVYYSRLGAPNREYFDARGPRIRIGRSPESDIKLDCPQIRDGEDAVVLRKTPDGWVLKVLELNYCIIGGRELCGGQTILIDKDEKADLFTYLLEFQLPTDQVTPDELIRKRLDDEMSNLMMQVHLDLLRRMDLRLGADPMRDDDESLQNLERNLDEISRVRGIDEGTHQKLGLHIAGHAVRTRILEELLETSNQSSALISTGRWRQLLTRSPSFEDELDRFARRLQDELGLAQLSTLSDKIDRVEDSFWNSWADRSQDLLTQFRVYLARRYLKKQIKDIVFGYGPLEDLVLIPSISEIMVVDAQHIYIERNGRLENSGRRFVSDEVTLAIIERIVSKVGRRIDKSKPLVDARLTDGSRVNAVIPPLAVSGPSLTIRKFPEYRPKMDDLVTSYRSLTHTAAEFLRAVVHCRKNIIISGGTGTGKTTLLNCISDYIDDRERVVTIEDTAELRLKKDHVVRLETKQANIEGAGEYSIRDLVKNSLRMRPDRIVVGECRGGEALDMLQAMNTGHDGSLTTIHANSSRDVILRLEVLVQMAAELPIESIHRQIASAVDVIVQLERLRNGRRVVSQITEVSDYDEREKRILTKDIFVLAGTESTEADYLNSLRRLSADDYEAFLSSIRAFGPEITQHVKKLRTAQQSMDFLSDLERLRICELLEFCGLGTRLVPTGCLPTFMSELIASNLIDLDSFYL